MTSLGESALILALKKKHEITAATIIIHGADCFIEDRWGKSAKDYASLPNLQVAAKPCKTYGMVTFGQVGT